MVPPNSFLQVLVDFSSIKFLQPSWGEISRLHWCILVCIGQDLVLLVHLVDINHLTVWEFAEIMFAVSDDCCLECCLQ